MAEDLKLLVNKAVNNGVFRGFNVTEGCLVDVIQFDDETIFVGDGSWNHLWVIKLVLKLIKININSHFLEVASSFLGCRSDKKEFIFLGIPIGSNPRRTNTWIPLLNNVRRRLSTWHGR